MDEKKDEATTKANVCPECGVDLSTGKMPEPEAGSFDRRAHAISHWGTDSPKTLTNPDARERAEIVLGNATAEKKEG